jgi:hypothetical protein
MSHLYRLALLQFSILLSFTIAGCAPRGFNHHFAAYKECVRSQSMEMIDSPHSAEDITKLASAQCQGNLAIVTEKLREDNAWMEVYGSNADGYTEKLRDKTNAEVAEEIRKARKQ